MQYYLKIGYYLQQIKQQYENYSFFFLMFICFFQDIHKTTTQNQNLPDYFIFNIVII
jgi:hypothetical protein